MFSPGLGLLYVVYPVGPIFDGGWYSVTTSLAFCDSDAGLIAEGALLSPAQHKQSLEDLTGMKFYQREKCGLLPKLGMSSPAVIDSKSFSKLWILMLTLGA